jgi:hypothetical protein
VKYIAAETETEDGAQLVLGLPVLELTERNLWALLEKLTDPNSARTLIDPEHNIAVRAVPNEEHYEDRAPGENFTNGVYS